MPYSSVPVFFFLNDNPSILSLDDHHSVIENYGLRLGDLRRLLHDNEIVRGLDKHLRLS